MTAKTNAKQTPFGSVLVANRGEIARRVFRTARDLGLRTVAIQVAADSDAPFTREADQVVTVPSYLDIEAIVAAAERTGAEAIHPGYGFLSENALFARAVIDAGLVWVGPSPQVIAAMGDKLEAKRRAVDAGVPVLVSTEDPATADDVGYPLLVKAAAGGGGKGMRIVNRPDELTEAVAAARREAATGFGDNTVFLERYVPRARHVEVQIMGDRYGTMIAHGERECSIQRRHQKIVEEAPSPGLDRLDGDRVRRAMVDAAIGLARSIGYESAGTVEFLLDDDTGEFYFLEVNTRLQVEHPVTEEARGLDLVAQQLAVAAGRPLSEADQAPATRAAIEVRLYAEDPANGFLPATGTIEALVLPDDNAIRWDLGVEQGSEVTIDFDPMIAKVTAAGADRAEAARRLAGALERLHLGGVVTNRDFLVNVLRSPAFLDGDTTTDFIERVAPPLTASLDDETLSTATALAALWLQGRNRGRDEVWGAIPTGLRIGRLPPTSIVFVPAQVVFDEAEGAERTVAYRNRRDGTVSLGVGYGHLDGAAVENLDLASEARVFDWQPGAIGAEIDGIRRRCLITAKTDRKAPGRPVERIWVQMPTTTVELAVVPRFVVPGRAAGSGGFSAPMPGRVVEVAVAAGDRVTAGQTLVVLEAMKMEHHMHAPDDGVVAEVNVAVGQQVAKDEVLLTMVEGTEETPS